MHIDLGSCAFVLCLHDAWYVSNCVACYSGSMMCCSGPTAARLLLPLAVCGCSVCTAVLLCSGLACISACCLQHALKHIDWLAVGGTCSLRFGCLALCAPACCLLAKILVFGAACYQCCSRHSQAVACVTQPSLCTHLPLLFA